MKRIAEVAVARVFAAYPTAVRRRLMVVRQLIFETAASIEGVGPIEETLKWGEPAYLTSRSKSGSTIRMGWRKSTPAEYAVYFNCQTNLVPTFRARFGHQLRFEGNRAIVFDRAAAIPTAILVHCLAAALTYHRDKGSLV